MNLVLNTHESTVGRTNEHVPRLNFRKESGKRRNSKGVSGKLRKGFTVDSLLFGTIKKTPERDLWTTYI